MQIYIACGLTHVPRASFNSYCSMIHELARVLTTQCGDEVSYALINSDPQLATKPFDERARLCYVWDKEMVEKSDLVIAEASYPSTGLGIELQLAASAGIPIIICFNRDPELRAAPVEYENPNHRRHSLQIGQGFVSLMALGVPTVFRVIDYSPGGSGLQDIVCAVDTLRRAQNDEAL